MVVLDITIANVSVPNIAGGLAVVAEPGHLGHHLLFGGRGDQRAADRLARPAVRRGEGVRRRPWCGFGVCSALCGLAPSLGVLVLFRVMQGLCGGPIMPLSPDAAAAHLPAGAARPGHGAVGDDHGGRRRSPARSLGGVLCDNVGWPWIFFINVPGGARSAPSSPGACSPAARPRPVKLPVDIVGLGLLIIWVGSLQIMLDKGKELDWFDSRFIVALAADVAALGFVGFLIWELTEHQSDRRPAGLPPSRLRRRDGDHSSHHLRRLLLHRRAAAALAADQHGLHRHPRGLRPWPPAGSWR